jgi:hypothetical protein
MASDRDTQIERIADTIESLVAPNVNGYWIDYSGSANAGSIEASRRKFAAALYDAGLRATPADSLDALRTRIEALPRQTQFADPFFPETYDYETVGLNAVLGLIAAHRAEGSKREHAPGDEWHRYRAECEICGQPGQVVVSVEPQRVEP